MSGKPAVLIIALLLIFPFLSKAQPKSPFSGDVSVFGKELTSFMGPNLKEDQLINLNRFLQRWDSASFGRENMIMIIDISSQLSSRSMRPAPHFNDYLLAINAFSDKITDLSSFSKWLAGLSELIFDPKYSNDMLDRYFKNTSSMITENVIFDSGTVKWKIKNKNLEFLHDTVFCVSVSDATLTCLSQRDSTEIYKVSGIYFPESQIFKGTKGIITWEKAGYQPAEVFAELGNFTLNTTKNNFIFDSVKFTNKSWFKTPVLGSLSDQSVTFTIKEKANFPRFESYTKHFVINEIFKGVNFEGGLSFEGAIVKGTGEGFRPAKITLLRNDTLYLKVLSKEFLFSKGGLNCQSASIALYLRNDSVYHTNIGFSYFANSRQVNFFRTNNPISKSPFFNSYHNLDMYFEYLSWNMNESKIILSRGRGASLGSAQFESLSYFTGVYFMQLMGLDDYHPLNRLIQFAEWHYSETFPVADFAKWLGKPQEIVTGMCIDLANRGFIFYDRSANEVTIKQKTKDFLASYAKKKDYDAINIMSETKSPVDNAVLDLKNLKLTIYGVKGVVLSDSQKVAIYPYNQKLIVGKNRNMEFDGIVKAGLFTIYGRNFKFSYDTFRIKLNTVDSLRLAIETDKRDVYGNRVLKDIDNLMQSGSAELFINDPGNKSGIKSIRKYPVFNMISDSYIFYDKLSGLDNIYKKEDFYFRIDPYTFENIDHFNREALLLPGEFVGGNILKPMRQSISIRENLSLGFDMVIPKEGIDLYGGMARLFNSIKMDSKGLTGAGTMNHLTSTTTSELYKFFPDSVITKATTFVIAKDNEGKYPNLDSKDVSIKWLIDKNEMLAKNEKGKSFSIFANGTSLDGSVLLTPVGLNGSGIVNMEDSKISSRFFNFASNSLKADTANYNIKSHTTEGYAFIAENARTEINFDKKMSNFRLNTDSSMVKFPEIKYICKMTDFNYNIETRVLNMEQKTKSDAAMMSPENLLKVNFRNLDKPTFFSTNNLHDTISFASLKGSYHLDQEFIEAENINYIRIADALIQPGSGKIIINRNAMIQELQNSVIALNNKHILHSAKVNIESTKKYSGSAVYDYIDDSKNIQQISFPELSVDTLTTTAKGFIPAEQKFMLNPAFSFTGDVKISSREDFLTFTGSAGINHNCDGLKSSNIKFKSSIDPHNVMIPIGEKPRDNNDNLVFSGSFINSDSLHIYPAFLSPQKSYTDVAVVTSSGWLSYQKIQGRYVITSLEKLADPSLPVNQVSLDKNFCVLSGEGKLNFGAGFDLVTLSSAGKVIQSIDSGKVNVEAILGLDFHFSSEALKIMANDIRMIPSLNPVNLSSENYSRSMKELIGNDAANQLMGDIDIPGAQKSLPKEFNFKLLLNDVNMVWNEASSSFRSVGKIGVGFVGQQPLNIYVEGYIDIQRRRSGDMIDIYLKAGESIWFYFSYFRGVMMTQSSDNEYNTLIVNTKLSDRKHPQATIRMPYTYMISSEDRLSKFLRRMTGENSEEDSGVK